MSLVALTHRRLATVNASALTMAAVLDAFWAAVDPSVTTYSDGSARSFSGTGATGWTWTRVQVAGVTEALYATPPGGTMNQRVIIAGRSAAPTPSPLMLAPETFTANTLLVGHQLGAGAFTTWNAALPFTNTRFSGYTRLGTVVTTGATSIACCIYESQETIWVECLYNGTLVVLACAGAMYDPETTASAAAETDGRRYGLITCGGQMVSNFLGSAGTGTLWVHSTSGGGNAHGYIWRPGSTTIDTVSRQWLTTGGFTAILGTDLAGQYAGQTLFMSASSSWAGRIREVSWGRPMLYHQRIESSPGVVGAYALAWSTTSATGDALFLKY